MLTGFVCWFVESFHRHDHATGRAATAGLGGWGVTYLERHLYAVGVIGHVVGPGSNSLSRKRRGV